MTHCCGIEPVFIAYTPTGIMASFEIDSDSPLDPFASIVFDNAEDTEAVQSMMWAKYRYRMISSCNPGRWVQAVKDRATVLKPKYELIFEAYRTNKTDLSDISSGYEDTSSATGEDTVTSTQEDVPATADASESQWLSGRQVTTTAPGTTVTTVHKDNSVAAAERLREALDAMPNLYERYADEYSDLFVNRWAL